MFKLFNNKIDKTSSLTKNYRQLSDLARKPLLIFDEKTESEFDRIKQKLLLGEKLIVVNDEDSSQKNFFIDDKYYLDKSHDYFCDQVYTLEVPDKKIVIEDIPSINGLSAFYHFIDKNGEPTLRCLKLTKDKNGVSFNTIKSLRTIQPESDINLPEHICLISDIHLLTDVLNEKLLIYKNDIETYNDNKSLLNIDNSIMQNRSIQDINFNLLNMFEIKHKIKQNETYFGCYTNKSLLTINMLEDEPFEFLEIISSILKKELNIHFIASPVFSFEDNNKYYSSVQEFKQNRIEELREFIYYFLNGISDPESNLFPYSTLYSKKDLKTLNKIAKGDFNFLFKEEKNINLELQNGTFPKDTHLILNLKSIYMIEHLNRDKISELKMTSNCLKINDEGVEIIILNTVNDLGDNIEIEIINGTIKGRFIDKPSYNLSFYFTREEAVKHTIDTIITKEKELSNTISKLKNLKLSLK